MFGFKFIKMQPTDYVIQYRTGKIVKEGIGLSFFYYAPFSSLVRIPVASTDTPFIFKEVTLDFQEVTVQGQITYRISDPMKLSKLMNFTLEPNGKAYTSDDPDKLPQRLINQAQVLTRDTLKTMTLKEALKQSGKIVIALREGFRNTETITNLGIEVVDFSILAIKPTPETSRALEAEARELILQEADEAIYSRRNSAVEQERAIKENELNTEIAIENKKRQIKETQMEAEKSVQQKRRELKEAEMAAKISLEEKNKELVALATENAKHEAETKAYSIAVMMKAISETDPKVIQSLASAGMDPSQLVAFAFKELAENASKIGQLNISPELLRELLSKQESK